ncbi:MAG: hypothetical protein IKH04_09870, partial [Kiritimatiellae bacterium]|nr:hypothetical protein [Kiritimatiellia bacterium]
ASTANPEAVPEGTKVRLTVADASGTVLGTIDRDWTGVGEYDFDTAEAISGVAFADGYDYTLEFSVVDADGNGIGDDGGVVATTALRLGSAEPWFSADPATGAVFGGAWTSGAGVSTTVFAADSPRSGLVRCEAALAGNAPLSASDLPELLGFAAENNERASIVPVAGDGGAIVWHGLVNDGGSLAWKPLLGGGELPTAVPVATAMELDLSSPDAPLVSYLVAGERLRDASGAEWFPAPGSAASAEGRIDAYGDSAVGSLAGYAYDKAVAEADGVRYATLAEALAAGDVTLLTNAEWPVGAPVGATAIDKDGHTLLRGGLAVQGDTVVVDSGPCAIAGEGTLRVTFGKLASVGVATAGRTPAQIAADLASNGANGIPRWQSLVLGLDANDPNSLPRAVIAMDGATVFVSEGGVAVDEESGATVTYQVIEVPDLAEPTSTVPVGEPAAPGEPVPLQLGDSASRFFRVRILITLPAL